MVELTAFHCCKRKIIIIISDLTLISRNILPILKTLTTLRSVGDTGKSSMRSSMTIPTIDAMTRTKSNRFQAVVK